MVPLQKNKSTVPLHIDAIPNILCDINKYWPPVESILASSAQITEQIINYNNSPFEPSRYNPALLNTSVNYLMNVQVDFKDSEKYYKTLLFNRANGVLISTPGIDYLLYVYNVLGINSEFYQFGVSKHATINISVHALSTFIKF